MQLDDTLVRDELTRILHSPGFAKAPRLTQFLTFIVETALNGRTESIKESIIGVEVFEREIGYDPKVEPVVRVQARRLRERLEEYYEARPQSSVTITLPKGAYIPKFELRPCVEPLQEHQSRSRWLWGVAATVLVTLGLGTFIMKWGRGQALSREPRPLTSLPGCETNPAWSPEGGRIAFAWNREAGIAPAIYIQSVAGGEPARLSKGSVAEGRPVWSPDGGSIAFLRNLGGFRWQVVVHALDTGSESVVATIQSFLFFDTAPGLAWSPGGKWLAVSDQPTATRPARLLRIDLDSGHQTVLTNPPVASSGDVDVRISPDGTQLAFQRGQLGELYVLNLTGRHSGQELHLGQVTQKLNGFDWVDNHTIVFASGLGAQGTTLWTATTDGSDARPLQISLQNVHSPVFDYARKRLAFVTQQHDVNIWRLALSPKHEITPMIASTRPETHVAISPRSGRLAFISARSGTAELWTANSNGSGAKQITHFNGEGAPSTPCWSPKEDEVALHVRIRGNSDIYAVKHDGSSFRQLTHEPSRELSPSYSRDGSAIYFSSDRTGEFQLFRLTLGSGAITQVTRGGAMIGTESLDGTALIFFGFGPQPQFSRKVLPDGEEDPLVPIDNARAVFSWTLGRRHLYFLTDSFYRLDLKTKKIEKLAEAERLPSAAEATLALTPNEFSLLFARLDVDSSDLMMIDRPFH